MGHGLSGVKEMDLPRFAERFCDAGFAVLLFDYRGFGESGSALASGSIRQSRSRTTATL
jgi:predicted alpha/beta hydrolase